MLKSARISKGLNTLLSSNPEKGFTLIELLIVVVIVAVLAAVVLVLINPIELQRSARDAVRMADLEGLTKAINATQESSLLSDSDFFCYNLVPPCFGNSNDANTNVLKNNGTGWVKINFVVSSNVSVSALPADPVNNPDHHYTYYSGGMGFEMFVALESNKYQPKMSADGGNNPNMFEMGSNLQLAL